jgi:hypothetical protein
LSKRKIWYFKIIISSFRNSVSNLGHKDLAKKLLAPEGWNFLEFKEIFRRWDAVAQSQPEFRGNKRRRARAGPEFAAQLLSKTDSFPPGKSGSDLRRRKLLILLNFTEQAATADIDFDLSAAKYRLGNYEGFDVSLKPYQAAILKL